VAVLLQIRPDFLSLDTICIMADGKSGLFNFLPEDFLKKLGNILSPARQDCWKNDL
jgi:hypothetical protein